LNAPYSNKALPKGVILREWRLEEVLGVGGFGIVYRGRGTYFDEMVAIKEYFPSAISDRLEDETVKPTDSSSEELYALGLRKFVEEAKILWQLSQPERHPNIVSVRSLFEFHGTAYMVMDFESGVSLSQMLRDGRRFDEQSLMAVLRPIAEGLDRAHRAGVLHRDIKPPNILVDDQGRPVLIDFGSARFDAGDATSTKVTFYTPPYAALEQYVKTYAQGPWTDIYALAVVAYQCVTGEKPPEVLERLHGGVGQPLSSRDWPGFSPNFTKAVDIGMGIRPGERPQSIADWLRLFDGAGPEDDLTRISIASLPVMEPPPTAPAATPAPSMAAEPKAVAAEPAKAKPASAAKRKVSVRDLGAVAAGVVLLAVGVGFGVNALMPKHRVAPAAPAGPAPGLVITPAPAAPAAGQQASTEAQGLVQDARAAGRPAAEIATLSDAAQKIAASTGQPGGQADSEAKGMAAHEAAALDRAVQSQAREVERVLGKTADNPDAVRALAAVRDARAKLAAEAAGAPKAADGAAALQGARRTLAAYPDFAGAYAAAQAQYLPVERSQFTALVARLRTTEDSVTALGAGPKPGLFASAAHKRAYQTLKANADQARARQAQIETLSSTVAAATDVRAIDGATKEAQGVGQALDALYASSSEAAQQAK
jgi:tRNA A-37 threonylcarbamoyl transferase component Bud32